MPQCTKLSALVLLVTAPQVIHDRIYIAQVTIKGILLDAGHQVAVQLGHRDTQTALLAHHSASLGTGVCWIEDLTLSDALVTPEA